MNNINKINDAWIASGQKVNDLNAKINAALLDENFGTEEFKNLKNARDTEVIRRDSLKDQLDVERKVQEVVNADSKGEPLNENEKDLKNKFVQDFKDMVRHDPRMNAVTSATGDDGHAAGLTIPADIQTAIHVLVRQYASLQEYVNIESVSTPNGSRVYEKWSDIQPLVNLDDESATIGDNDDPKLMLIKYTIKRFAGISTATNTLLKDSAENILGWLSNWIAKKVVVTRNQAIIAVMNAVPKKPTLANFDDIKDMMITSVDPAIRSTSFFLTNTSGFAVLAKVKDAEGRYLMTNSVTNPETYMIGGKAVIEIADRWLPDTGTKDAPAHPLYFGDLKQAVTLFDRENMSLYTTDVGGGAFETDTTKIRVIDRFDVEATDAESFVAGSFTNIADQLATDSGTASK
ncbi:phage major capsid protein [Pediococcus stilesii]|uniref:Phage major capsid protein n=1 Tax=Pediococcus stilesii TaxID=331679 RepID=A0A5R9BSI8_9LACO|nr:phage major capsid protein [Pediococcus stilesii]TLQ03644.1 phage major capsid protein [Pediococcus stilesii]